MKKNNINKTEVMAVTEVEDLLGDNVDDIETEELEVSELGFNGGENPFSATRKIFSNYLLGKEQWSFDEWAKLPDDDKAAALYLNFYDQITLSAYKVISNAKWVDVDELVETTIQYLDKNVKIIKNDPKRYTPAYIYKITDNALRNVAFYRKGDKERYQTTSSNIVDTEDGEIDVFETYMGSKSAEDTFFDGLDTEALWNVVKSLGPDAQDVALKLINGESFGRKNSEKRFGIEMTGKLKMVLAQAIKAGKISGVSLVD